MAINSLYPSFIQQHYHSAFGKHVMTLPTRQYTGPAVGHPSGSYTSWTAGTVDAEDMINALISKIIVIADAHTIFDYCIFFNYPAPLPADPVPIAIFNQNVPGDVAHTDGVEALQQTYTFFDTAFQTVKLVLLDLDATFTLVPEHESDLDADHLAVVNAFRAGGNAFSSRAGFQPSVLRSVINKPNDKLRKEYHLS